MGPLLPDPDRLGVAPLLKIWLEKFLRNGMSPISGILGKKTLKISSKSYTVIFYLKLIILRTYAKKPSFYSKSLFLTHKYLGETWFLSFIFNKHISHLSIRYCIFLTK